MTQCGQRTGFLTFSVCGEAATATCLKCGKLLCARHIQTSASGPLCPDCAVIGLDEDEASRRGLSSSYHRWHTDYYDTYTVTDYSSFSGQGGEMGGGGGAGDWDSGGEAGDSDMEESGGAFQDS